MLIDTSKYHQTCWRNAWLQWAQVCDSKNCRKFVEYEDTDDEWFQRDSYFFNTHFRGSQEEWSATRTTGIKTGELEKWINKRELGLVTLRSGSQKIAKTRINQYPWYWPIASDIAISTYTGVQKMICPCLISNGWVFCNKQCAYRKRIFSKIYN